MPKTRAWSIAVLSLAAVSVSRNLRAACAASDHARPSTMSSSSSTGSHLLNTSSRVTILATNPVLAHRSSPSPHFLVAVPSPISPARFIVFEGLLANAASQELFHNTATIASSCASRIREVVIEGGERWRVMLRAVLQFRVPAGQVSLSYHLFEIGAWRKLTILATYSI
jgi:hypothetical protein